ncbi:MAG: hypothetical protein AAF871_12980 [Pseudomonadota bacterium]
MLTAKDQKAVFAARLARIKSKRVASKGGPPPQIPARIEGPGVLIEPVLPPARTDIPPVPPLRENLGYPAGLVGAFLIGMAAVFVARLVRFHYSGSPLVGEDPGSTMLIDGAVAFGVGLFFRAAFKFEAPVFILTKSLGITVMLVTMHNFVHWAPKTFEALFSREYVYETRQQTEVNSVFFRGVSYVLIEEGAAQASAMPTRIQMGR